MAVELTRLVAEAEQVERLAIARRNGRADEEENEQEG